MANANIFQKFRAQTPATATAALVGFLTLATPFSNATAQEPRATAVSTNPTAATPDVQRGIDEANRKIDQHIRELRNMADEARRAARGEITDGKDSEHPLFRQAQSHSAKYPDEAGFFIIEGKNSAMTGEKVEQTILARFSKNEVTAKPFRNPDHKGESTVIGIYVRGELVGFFPLDRSAIKGVDQASELVKNPPLKVSASVTNAPRAENQ